VCKREGEREMAKHQFELCEESKQAMTSFFPFLPEAKIRKKKKKNKFHLKDYKLEK